MLPSGYQISLACGPLKKARYINPAIEKELAEFKEEIRDKFTKSTLNRTYGFPRFDSKTIENSLRELPQNRLTSFGAPGTAHSLS